FATRIRSNIVSVPLSDTQTGDALAPDFDHLVQSMQYAASHGEEMRARGVIGARHVAEGYTWDRVTELLLGELFCTVPEH
ncbi:MAG: hypothetical protein LC729_03490, partial [Acidobacteria bacterium]|nr:hypothetical protein [Acidobacteriota bacterium]